MLNAATERPTYIQQEREDKLEKQTQLEFETFLQTPKGEAAFQAGQEAVGYKRVFVKGYGVENKVYAKRPNTFKKNSIEARAWEAGFNDRRFEVESMDF